MMINLDNNATTALDPAVLEDVIGAYTKDLGNPGSQHRLGQKAKALLASSCKEVASYFAVKSSELVFTSSATEGLNMVLKGVFSPHFTGHLITSSLEHAAVFQTALWLQARGVRVTFLDPPKGQGCIDPTQVEHAIARDTKLIALMAANNETGVKTDIDAIGAVAKGARIAFLVDGVALLGKEPLQIHEGVSAICFSGHKIHGPAGVGLTIVERRLVLDPLIIGGPQQQGRRGGTENVPGIVGFAKALTRLNQELPNATKRMAYFRDKLEKTLIAHLPDVILHSHEPRICNTSNISFPGTEGEMLLMHLDLANVLVSYGSACSSGALEPSRVLRNMGVSKELAQSSLRFSLSRNTTEEEIDRAAQIIIEVVRAVR